MNMLLKNQFIWPFLTLFFFLLSTSAFAETTPKVETVGGIEFVLIEGGSFIMGDITGRDPYASPAHKVVVQDFYLGKYEITFDQYDIFCEATNRDKPSDEGWGRGNRPVINVSWEDALAFTKWLSEKHGRNFRLPSESEWEYAARGGKQTHYWWGNRMQPGLANCRNCQKEISNQSRPVGTYSPNPFGLFDTNGNVYEWVADDFHRNYEGVPNDGTARKNGDNNQRIARGGAWLYDDVESTTHARYWDISQMRNNIIGIRLALD